MPIETPSAPPEMELSLQEAKSARTRGLICEAAARCLVEHGYRETSVLRVQSMAGVSRGALTHQYPTKLDMMAAVAEHLMEAVRRTRAPGTQARPSPDDPDYVAWHFRSAWGRLFHTQEGRALSEIFSALRTDEALNERIAPMIEAWDESIERWFLRRVTSPKGDAEMRQIVHLFRALARGLSFERCGDLGRIQDEQAQLIERFAAMIAPHLQPREDGAQPETAAPAPPPGCATRTS